MSRVSIPSRRSRPASTGNMASLAAIRDYFHLPITRWGRTFLLSGAVGILSGLAAAALEYGLDRGVENIIGRFGHVSGAAVLTPNLGILLLPAFGGLLAGLLLNWLYPEEREHGTNQMVAAFHRRGGNMPLGSPTVKAVAAVGAISFGGSAGPEGPIAALGAGIGSSLARALHLTPTQRRLLLIAGCAGGVGAIFRCPLGGALFATSVLYREPEFESESIVPALVASVISYSTYMSFWGFGHHMLEGADRLVFASALDLPAYAILGVFCGLLGMLLYKCMHFIESRPLRRMGIPAWLAPGLGGLAVGALGCALPQVMDARYEFLQHAMAGSLYEDVTRSWWHWAALFGLVAVVKCVASAITVGSARAGGLLGPSVFIGGAAGACVGAAIEALSGGDAPDPLRQSLLAAGMAGVLAAAMRTPMAAIVMVTEMTGSYGLIVPLMLVCTISYVVGRRWGLNTAQVRSASESPAHAGDALVHMLQAWRVRDLVEPRWPYVISPSTTLGEMATRMNPGSRPVFAVVDGGRLVGLISVSDISRMLSEPGISELVIAADMMTTDLTVAAPDQSVYDVLETFRTSGYEVIPVVSPHGEPSFLGMLTRHGIHEAVRRQMEEIRGYLHDEHAGLVAIEQDEQLYQLVIGIAAPRPDTIQRIPVPDEAVGQSIRASDFRRNHGAQVIAVQNEDGSLQCPPDIDAPLRADQLLLVILGPGPPGGSPGPTRSPC